MHVDLHRKKVLSSRPSHVTASMGPGTSPGAESGNGQVDFWSKPLMKTQSEKKVHTKNWFLYWFIIQKHKKMKKKSRSRLYRSGSTWNLACYYSSIFYINMPNLSLQLVDCDDKWPHHCAHKSKNCARRTSEPPLFPSRKRKSSRAK